MIEINVEELLIRTGQLGDCEQLARLINESAEGAANYLFDGAQGASAQQVMRGLLEREVHYSYANAEIAQIGDDIVGMVLSFPATGLILSKKMQQYYSPEQFQYIQYFADNKLKDCWHLDAICVDAKYRGNEIGKRLLSKVKQQAAYYQFPLLEVFVFGTNTDAIRFYQRNGFVVHKEIQTKGHEFLGKRSPLILMRCNLSEDACWKGT